MKKLVRLVIGPEPTAWGSILHAVQALAIVAATFWLIAIGTNSSQKVSSQEQQQTESPKVRAIVVCCSDPRLCMYKKIRERYGLMEEECFPIVVPGGPDPLANPVLMDCKCLAEKTDLDIILEHPAPSMTMVIVAEHEDCACIKHYGFTDPHQGKKDFPAIKEFFAKRTPELELVMLYFSFTDKEKGLVNPNPEVVKID